MRRLFLISYFILFGIVVPPTASSQTVTTAAQAKVAAILAQFPNGGLGLSDAIAVAVEADPTLAATVVAAALTATPVQQQAIGTGMAIAATFFANAAAGLCKPQDLPNAPPCPNPDAARSAELLIQAAIGSAPTIAQTAFAAGGGFATLTTALGGGTTNLSTGTCISPSGPGGTCR